MRSLLGRFHRPMSRGLVNNMLTMNNLGDGSTLSLDFTTMGGVLDPRLTFSRASTATFVNSSGYVEYAAANLLRNSGWLDSNPTPTNWTLIGNAVTIPATGFRTFTTTTAATSFITDGGISLSQGITYSAVIEVSAVSGSPTMINTMVATASPTNEKWYQNGTLVTSGTVITSGTITYVFTAGSGSFVRCGLGSTGSTVTSQSVTFTKPRIVPGVSINATYYESTTSAAYHAPRFDYSPTNIGEPRGLLIEGQATNLCPESQSLSTSWSQVNANTPTVPTSPSVNDPFGGTSLTWKIVATATSGVHGARHDFLTSAATATYSFFAKAAEYDRVILADPGTGVAACTFVLTGLGTATTVPNLITPTNATMVPLVGGWYRCSVTMPLTTSPRFMIGGYPSTGATISGFGASYTGDNTSGVYATGMQLELGSGASSYIPTGASQVTRNADYLLSASSSGAGRSTEFSLDDLAPGTSALNQYTVLWTYGRDPNSKRDYPASLYARTNANTLRIDMRDFSGTTAWVATQTRTVQNVTVGTASKLKLALSQNTSAYPISAINGTSATFTSGIIDSALGLKWVQLCNTSMVSGAWNPIWAQQLKVYPTALTAAQLQTLTTL